MSDITVKRIDINGMVFHLSKCGKSVCCSIACTKVNATNDVVVNLENILPIDWEPVTQVNGYGSSAAETSVGFFEYVIGANSRTFSYKFRGSVFAFCNFTYHTKK